MSTSSDCAVADDQPGVAPAPAAVGLEVGVAAVAELVQALRVRHAPMLAPARVRVSWGSSTVRRYVPEVRPDYEGGPGAAAEWHRRQFPEHGDGDDVRSCLVAEHLRPERCTGRGRLRGDEGRDRRAPPSSSRRSGAASSKSRSDSISRTGSRTPTSTSISTSATTRCPRPVGPTSWPTSSRASSDARSTGAARCGSCM